MGLPEKTFECFNWLVEYWSKRLDENMGNNKPACVRAFVSSWKCSAMTQAGMNAVWGSPVGTGQTKAGGTESASLGPRKVVGVNFLMVGEIRQLLSVLAVSSFSLPDFILSLFLPQMHHFSKPVLLPPPASKPRGCFQKMWDSYCALESHCVDLGFRDLLGLYIHKVTFLPS